MTEPLNTPTAPQQAPIVVAVPQSATRAPSTPRPKQRPAWAKPPVLITGALVVLVVELAAYAGLGLVWWLVANAALAALLFGGAVAWRRRAGGGLLDRLFAGRRGRAAMGAAGTNVSRMLGTGGRGRAGGPLGGHGAAGGRSGGGLRSLLPRLLGGTRGRAGAGRSSGASGGAAGGSGSGRRGGLLARLRGRGRSAAGGSPGGAAGGAAGGRRGLFAGPRGRAGGQAAGSSGSGTRAGGVRGALRRLAGGRSGGGTQRGQASKRSTGSRWNPLAWKSWRPGDTGAAPANRRKADKATIAAARGVKPGAKPTGDQPGRKPSLRPVRQTRPAGGTSTPDPVEQRPALEVPTKPRHGSTGGGTMTSPMGHSDDASLQRWGANLKGAEAAAEEVRRKYAEAAAAAEQFRTVFGKIAQQGENELPASNRVMADIDSVVTRAKSAVTPEEWGSVAADCAVLPTRYQQEHETDEDRLHASRKSRAAEKRADITAAEQDN